MIFFGFIRIFRVEIVTFGKIAGKNASKKSKEIKESDTFDKRNSDDFIDNILIKDENKSIYLIKKELSSLMFAYAGLFRTKSDLENLLYAERISCALPLICL